MQLTDTQLSNLLLIHSNASAGTKVTPYYGTYWMNGVRFEIGKGAMWQLYRKGVIEDIEEGVRLTAAGTNAVEDHNVCAR